MKYTGSFTQNNQIQFPVSIIPGSQCYPCQKGQRLNGYQTNCITLVYVFSEAERIHIIVKSVTQVFNITVACVVQLTLEDSAGSGFSNSSTQWSEQWLGGETIRCSLQNLKTKFSIFFCMA